MDARERRALAALAQKLEANVSVGKSGVTPGVLAELEARLSRSELVKVRFLKSAREGAQRQELADSLATGARAEVVEVRGNTVVLWRAKSKRGPGANVK
ncbi:MAG TPA: YhbY family RNA-binding protein [Candidatus Thermoplasmatota archaeon]|nr:YhbY family RNA-binding protein [Candidatus Thermoplasmatota archaeon]